MPISALPRHEISTGKRAAAGAAAAADQPDPVPPRLAATDLLSCRAPGPIARRSTNSTRCSIATDLPCRSSGVSGQTAAWATSHSLRGHESAVVQRRPVPLRHRGLPRQQRPGSRYRKRVRFRRSSGLRHPCRQKSASRSDGTETSRCCLIRTTLRAILEQLMIASWPELVADMRSAPGRFSSHPCIEVRWRKSSRTAPQRASRQQRL